MSTASGVWEPDIAKYGIMAGRPARREAGDARWDCYDAKRDPGEHTRTKDLRLPGAHRRRDADVRRLAVGALWRRGRDEPPERSRSRILASPRSCALIAGVTGAAGAAPGVEPPDAAVEPVFKEALDRETPRRTMDGFLRETKEGNFRVAASYLDLTGIPAASRDEEGPDLAQKLALRPRAAADAQPGQDPRRRRRATRPRSPRGRSSPTRSTPEKSRYPSR